MAVLILEYCNTSYGPSEAHNTNIGYKSDANNSNGFGADKGKYISYDFSRLGVAYQDKALGHYKNEKMRA